jgi:hypothetical protein
VEWVKLQPAFPLMVTDRRTPWNLFSADAWLRIPVWSTPLHRWRTNDDAGDPALHFGADSFAGEKNSVSLRAACDGPTFARLYATDGEKAVFSVRARAVYSRTTAFELAFIQDDGVAWGTVVPLTTDWRTIRIPLRDLHLFTQWDAGFAARAGSHLRLSRLQALNVCFGKWLFRDTANEAHAFEISAINVVAD